MNTQTDWYKVDRNTDFPEKIGPNFRLSVLIKVVLIKKKACSQVSYKERVYSRTGRWRLPNPHKCTYSRALRTSNRRCRMSWNFTVYFHSRMYTFAGAFIRGRLRTCGHLRTPSDWKTLVLFKPISLSTSNYQWFRLPSCDHSCSTYAWTN